MKRSDIDELFEETYSSYNSKIDEKVIEIKSIIMEIKDTNSKYSLLKDKLVSMFTDEDFTDLDSVELHELFSGILRDINRLNSDLFNLIQEKVK
jgi:hypothetical protein